MSAAVLREVRLYGDLGRQFGRVFHLAVATPREAARALCAVLPGFERMFLGRDGRQAYHVFVGRRSARRDIAAEQVEEPLGAADPIRFVPVIAGAKRGGVLQTILGVILVVVGAYYGSPELVQLGVSMIIGGVIQLLSPQRQGKDAATANLPSYAFDGPVNNTEQGGPVPLKFGRIFTGSTVVSQGLSTERLLAPVAAAPAPAPAVLPPYEPRNPDLEGSGR